MKTIKLLVNFIWKIIPFAIVAVLTVILYCYFNYLIVNKFDVVSSIINNIISGIITAIIIFFVHVLWKKNISAWIENLLYQDVHIEGEWSGFIVPYFGLADLDEMAKNMAWNIVKNRIAREKYPESKNAGFQEKSNEKTEASIIDDKTGKEEPISAEIIVQTQDNQKPDEPKKVKKTIQFSFSPEPIIIRAELNRVGHTITGRLIEIGGASKIHTYTISGTFKNLILNCTYEVSSKDHIDRGSLALMLVNNGTSLEGFFSSYADNFNKIIPMQCVLRKMNQVSETTEK